VLKFTFLSVSRPSGDYGYCSECNAQ
jgi:hypothetical protein